MSNLFIPAIFFIFSIISNDLKEISLENQKTISDLVFVGRAGEKYVCNTDGLRCINFTVDVEFKNNSKRRGSVHKVMVDSYMAEEALFSCCDKNEQYLLFLKYNNKGYYQPVNGVHSVIKLKD